MRALVRASLPGWRRNRVLRTGFCALQAIDDLLDGDRACDGEPLDVVEKLVAQIESRRFEDDSLARLVGAFVRDLGEVGGEPALADGVRLIRVMQEDRRRRRDGLLLDTASLREHHRQTFSLSVDLMLIAGRCELRASNVPELIEALGWCSVVRDLEPDLRAGLINLPREATSASSLAKEAPTFPEGGLRALRRSARTPRANASSRSEGESVSHACRTDSTVLA